MSSENNSENFRATRGGLEHLLTSSVLGDNSELYFFSKDRDTRLLEANEAYMRSHGAQSADEIFGAANEDLFSRKLANLYTLGDQCVLNTGNPQLHKIEKWQDQEGVLHHILISRFPKHDENGNVLGIFGVFSKYQEVGTRASSPYSQYADKLAKVMRILKHDMPFRPSFDDLSRRVGISERHLRRVFKDEFGLGLKEYALQLKLTEAKRLLRLSEFSLIDVAMACGFCDQSYFCTRFHREEGITPLRFREKSRLSIQTFRNLQGKD